MIYSKKVIEPEVKESSCFIEKQAEICRESLRAVGRGDFNLAKYDLIENLKRFRDSLAKAGYDMTSAEVDEMIVDVCLADGVCEMRSVISDKRIIGITIKADAELRRRCRA